MSEESLVPDTCYICLEECHEVSPVIVRRRFIKKMYTQVSSNKRKDTLYHLPKSIAIVQNAKMYDARMFHSIMCTILHRRDFRRYFCLYWVWISWHIYMDRAWHLRVCCVSCLVCRNTGDVRFCVQFL